MIKGLMVSKAQRAVIRKLSDEQFDILNNLALMRIRGRMKRGEIKWKNVTDIMIIRQVVRDGKRLLRGLPLDVDKRQSSNDVRHD